ncbi:coiled-coil domain-containing protein 62 isoform X3 [Sceloporus undulatus]|uniref:coiled-coil domain-containing protein 62 isoform X3 n=1 Tax=Sceloporus undulatus TaxID=8520 RepID=UPI001C4B9C69|nr:coiled-coil domain-containing protein 62 isoform X3 [Sceloporus undulatus]
MNSSLALGTLPQNSTSEPDSMTIQRQRKELQLLIAELKDRDKELNEMVTVHQRQLLAWEDDRQKFLTLAERCSRLENELHKRNEMITTLTRRLKLLESQQNDRKMTLENTQQKLQDLSKKASDTSLHCQALEDKNQALNSLVMELSSKVGQLQAREQELLTVLKLKDNDILEASNHISEFMCKFKKLENALRAARMEEANVNKEKQDFIVRVKQLTLETNRLKSDLSEKTKESNEKREEIIRLKQENGFLNNELLLSAERANRRDQLLQSAKSKQRRTDTELSNLRQIYVKQQRDLQFLHFSMESSQEIKQKPKPEVQETSDHDVGLKFSDLDAPCLTSTQKTSESDGHEKFFNTEFPLQLMNVTDDQAANGCGHPTISHDSCSPSSKLQRLLAESQQMVADLELTNLLGASPFCSPKSSQHEVTEYTDSLCKVRLPEEKSKTKLSLHSL